MVGTILDSLVDRSFSEHMSAAAHEVYDVVAGMVQEFRRCASWASRRVASQGSDQALKLIDSLFSAIKAGRARKQQHPRMVQLDGLKGLLAIGVVLHHAQCLFHPCSAFGASAAMVRDIRSCDDDDANPFRILSHVVSNATFCSCMFCVVSGLVLSYNLWKASVDDWRVAVTKRPIRLGINCIVALVMGRFIVAIANGTKHVVRITGTKWLQQQELLQTSHIAFQFPWHILGGLWNGTSGVGDIQWALSVELFGSYLTFGLVLLLKTSPHRIRSRWLAAMFVALLVPNSTTVQKLQTSVSYGVATAPHDHGTPQADFRRTVELETNHHLHLLSINSIEKKVNKNSRESLKMEFLDSPARNWFINRQNHTERYQLDNMPPETDFALDNGAIYEEMLNAVHGSHKHLIDPTIVMKHEEGWTTSNSWLLYAPFVAGVWMSEMYLSGIRPTFGPAWLSRETRQMLASWVFPIIAFLCASYPLGETLVAQSGVWTGMMKAAHLLGFSKGDDVMLLWCTVGSVCIIYYLTFHAHPQVAKFLTHPLLTKLGAISFPLYLVHLPILFSLTSPLFVALHRLLDEEDGMLASTLALLLSFPIMLSVAYGFQQIVDTPSLFFSNFASREFIGLLEDEKVIAPINEIKKPQATCLMENSNNSARTESSMAEISLESTQRCVA